MARAHFCVRRGGFRHCQFHGIGRLDPVRTYNSTAGRAMVVENIRGVVVKIATDVAGRRSGISGDTLRF